MADRYSELKSRYEKFIAAYKNKALGKEEALEQAKILLMDIRNAGEIIFDDEQRNALSNFARHISKAIFELSDYTDFPSRQLKAPVPKDKNAIEFVGRIDDLQFMTNSFCPPYLLINAPRGYGKTRLMEKVKEHMRQQQWLCILLTLSREQSYSMKDLTYLIFQQLGEEEQSYKITTNTPEELGVELGRYLALQKTQSKIMLMIDEVEALSELQAKEFLTRFIPNVKEGLSVVNRSFRVICAGRYISHWEQWGMGIPLHSRSLKPFDFRSVYETVEKFDSKNELNSRYKLDFAAHLMFFTGGHPGSTAAILTNHFGYPINSIASKKKEYYDTIVKPVIDEIIQQIPDDLETIFVALSVVRRFNAHLLKHFIEKGLIQWATSEYELELTLLKTYLVNQESSFLKNETTRRLLAIHLRQTDQKQFIAICEESILFWKSRLQDATSFRPDMITLELLFQQVKYLDCTQHRTLQEFFKMLTETLEFIVTIHGKGRAIEVINGLKDLLGEDWEFRFLFNYLLRDESYNDEQPFGEFMQKIATFIMTLQGGQ